MGDNGEIKKEEISQTQEPKPITPITLVILLLPEGRVTVTGPINDRLLCYGMLEMAKEIIKDFKDAKKIDADIGKNHNLINFLRSRRQ